MQTRTATIVVGSLAYLTAFSVHAACGSTGCSVNTYWETQGPQPGAGLRLDVRVEYIKQDTLRSGSHKTQHAVAEEAAHTEGAADLPARAQHEGEAHAAHDERETTNRNLRLHVDYSFDANWGVSVEAPIVSRRHRHIALASGETEKWDFTSLGDVRVLGRYATARDAHSSWGVTFGAKLPTGKFDEKNDEGETAERSLQPGTGTTDALLGVFYQRSRAESAWSWFGQLSVQQPLNSRDDFKPGRQILADLGTGYRVTPRVSAVLQLNLQHRARDHGGNAEPEDSGGRFAFLSPGVQVQFGVNTRAYAFLQIPVYQYVNGTQLTPDEALLVGVTHRF